MEGRSILSVGKCSRYDADSCRPGTMKEAGAALVSGEREASEPSVAACLSGLSDDIGGRQNHPPGFPPFRPGFPALAARSSRVQQDSRKRRSCSPVSS